ncbi:DUF3472 domain-containing protein [Arundinibacter roseus]|uniref:DUF3472 domain-containing protein n=1 Tax=Arundinibacter roseus TaxID=2070510 RepID=A0A4R4KIZ6_9BACT|nr:DUF3472 domain-containing protein [Arundinibacter roseus]TDB68234.1 DUF3472 domain-containing protein [Arundinibacter roseus]
MQRTLKYLLVLLCGLRISNLSAERVSVPIGGNSWVEAGITEKISADGLSEWSEKQAILTTWVRFSEPATFKLYLTGKSNSKSTIRVTIAGKSQEVEWVQNAENEIFTGKWGVKNSGYVKIELQGLSRSDSIFGMPHAWILEGEELSNKLSFVKNNEGNFFYWGRRGPSVHLNYAVPAKMDSVEWFYNELTVPPTQDVVGSYFMANGFAEGYFGMQVNSDSERRILFSVWSPFSTDDPNAIPDDQKIRRLKKGDAVYTGEFGNEGSGGQSYLKFPWKAGKTYKFLLHGAPSGDSTTTYTAYFFAPEVNQWQLIASFKRPRTHTYLARLHSFLENFIPETGQKSRRVYFGNQWIRTSDGLWTEISAAKFSADNTARKGYRMDYAGGSEGRQFYLQNCGFFSDPTPIGIPLQRLPAASPPDIDFEKLPGN